MSVATRWLYIYSNYRIPVICIISDYKRCQCGKKRYRLIVNDC